MARYKFPKGHTINKGKKLSPEHREKVIKTLIPFPKGHKFGVGIPCSSEKKEKIRASNIGKKRSKETKKANSEAGKKKWQDPEYRAMMIRARKGNKDGEKHPMFGKKHSAESRKKMSESHIGLQVGENHPMFGHKHTQEALKKMLCINSPNKAEIKLNKLLDKMYPGEWKFVGDGQVIIDGKCPDFITTNKDKKIIELYGERWHEPHEEQERIDFFKQHGYETLIIWCQQLNKSGLAEKMIREFNATTTRRR